MIFANNIVFYKYCQNIHLHYCVIEELQNIRDNASHIEMSALVKTNILSLKPKKIFKIIFFKEQYKSNIEAIIKLNQF